MKFMDYIKELSYGGNLGFHEMVLFYRKATDAEIKEMEKIIKNNDWDAFKKIIKRVIGVTLK